tara:strand:- start:361 stop:783 length:423 start_codon:yes stop_codon:yes gene_type:complete
MNNLQWDHLANAESINRAIDLFKKYPFLWIPPPTYYRNTEERIKALGKTGDGSKGHIAEFALYKEMGILHNLTGIKTHILYDAILALMTWDNCAYMLDSDTEEISALARKGNPQAILLLPVCIIFNLSPEDILVLKLKYC